MKTFTDTAGRTWEAAITVATVKAVRAKFGIDLMNAKTTLRHIADDPIAFCDVLFACLKGPEGVSADDFIASLSGDALEAATDAFLEAYADFFPKGRREILRKLLARGREVEERENARAQREMEKLLAEAIPWDMSTPSPAASASPRTDSPSGNSPGCTGEDAPGSGKPPPA